MLIFLLLLALDRPYHPETVASIATSRHTHVQVTGRVTMVRREADGDLHIRLVDGDAFLIAEITPGTRARTPRVGSCVQVQGIRRYDNELGHGWWEVHPVEHIRRVTCQ